MVRTKARLLSSASALAAALALPGAVFAQDADPVPMPPSAPTVPTVVVPFDVLATSLGNAEGAPIGGNNAILRFNGQTGATLDPFLTPDGSPLFNDPRDIVLNGSQTDPNATYFVHTGQFPASNETGFIDSPDFDNIIEVGLDGSVIGVVGDFSAATTLTPVTLDDGSQGPLVDAGGGVFGPGGNFFSGSRATGEIVETNPTTGEVLEPIGADFSAVDFPRGFVFDAQGNLYLGNGSDPGTGEGTDQILFFANNGDGTFADPVEFAAPEGFSPLDVILSPDGTQLVVSSEFPFEGGATPNAGQIFVFTIDPSNPATSTAVTSFNPTDADGNSLIVAPRGLGFGPDGLLYASSTGSDEIFRFNFATGELVDEGAFATTENLFGQALNFLTLFGECTDSGCGRVFDQDGISVADAGSFTLAAGGLSAGAVSLGGSSVVGSIDGQISVAGSGAVALTLPGTGDLTVSGLVETSGDAATSVLISGSDSSFDVTATGFVAASGDGSTGVSVTGSGNTVAVLGTVLAGGDQGTAIDDTGSDTSITVGVGGSVFATGDNGTAVRLAGSEGSLTVEGTLSGAGAADFVSPGTADTVYVTGSDYSVTVAAGGSVSSQGDFASAIATDSTASIEIAGTVSTTGDNASALRIAGASSVTNTGTSILTSGAGSAGILVLDNATVINSGLIETTGAGSPAVPVTTVLDPSALPTAQLENVPSAGVIFANGGGSLTNSGTIRSATGPAIYSSSDLAAVQVGGSLASLAPVTITNEAGSTIEGGASAPAILGGALSEQVTNLGTIMGDVLLGGGSDIFTIDISTGSVSGNIDGGDGPDILNVSGTGTFAGASNFEEINFSGGAITLGADTTTVGFANLTDGVVLDLNGFEFGGFQETVQAAGTSIGGTGSFNSDLIASGTISPGETAATLSSMTPTASSVGTLSIDGDFTLTETGTYIVSVTNAGTDQIVVDGAAQIDGTIDLAFASDLNIATLSDSTLTPIVASSTTGAGAVVNVDFETADGIFSVSAISNTDDGDLNIVFTTEADITPGLDLSGDDVISGDALSLLYNISEAGGQTQQEIFALVGSDAVASVQSTSPVFYDAFIQAGINLSLQFNAQIHERLLSGVKDQVGFWTTGSFETFERDAPTGFDYDIDSWSVSAGVDYALGPLILGLAGNYSEADVDVGGLFAGFNSGSGETRAFGGAAYVGTAFESGLNVAGSVGYQFLDIEADRFIGGGPTALPVSADFDPGQLIAEVRGSYTLKFGDAFYIRPRVGVDFTVTDSETFEETGDTDLALSAAAQSYEEIAGTGALDLGFNVGILQVFAGAGVRHNFQDDGREFAFVFQGLEDVFPLVVNGEDDRTEFVPRGGIRANILPNVWFTATFEGRYSANNDTTGVHGGFYVTF